MSNDPVQNHPDNQWPVEDKMTDDGLINDMAENLEGILNANLEGNGLHTVQNLAIKDRFYRLIALARIGAAVQPRPISEAPKDGTPVLWLSTQLGWQKGHWANGPVMAEWCEDEGHMPLKDCTHFFPLSSLPQVKP